MLVGDLHCDQGKLLCTPGQSGSGVPEKGAPQFLHSVPLGAFSFGVTHQPKFLSLETAEAGNQWQRLNLELTQGH